MDNRLKILIIIGLVGIFGLIGFTIVRGGTQGLLNLIGNSMKILIVLGILFGIGFLVYWLIFYVKKVDARLEVMKNIQSETRMNRPHNLGRLYSTGDSEHIPICFGDIVGFSSRQNYGLSKDDSGEYYKTESIFRIRKIYKFPILQILNILFFKRDLIRIPCTMHDRLQGDVNVKCASLVKHGYFFYPDTMHLDFDAIDKTQFNESLRYINLDISRFAHPLVLKALGVTSFDKRELEGQTGLQQIKESGKG